MAPQKRKRQQITDFPPDETRSKKTRYDNFLSTPRLTRDALRELNRQNKLLPPRSQPKLRFPPSLGSRGAKLAALGRLGIPDIVIFAAAGGPDLSDLRKSCEPTDVVMTSTISKTKQSEKTGKTERYGAHENGFEEACIKYGIYPPGHELRDHSRPPEPNNIEEIRAALGGDSRCPLLTEDNIAKLKKSFETRLQGNEATVMHHHVPIILGNPEDNKHFWPKYEEKFSLDSLTGGKTRMPKPDLMDGVHQDDIRPNVRGSLELAPNRNSSITLAPNFFLEAKSIFNGVERQGIRQIMQDGAYGAHFMHRLQNYNKQEEVYDGNAYTYSVTFQDIVVKLFTHHLAPPAEPQQTPICYTTMIDCFPLISYTLEESFEKALKATRNLRYRAKDERYRFIEEANKIDREMFSGQDAGNVSDVDDSDSETIVEPDEENDNQRTQGSRVGSTDDLSASVPVRQHSKRGRPRKILHSPPPLSSARHTKKPANQAESSRRRRSQRIAKQ
ncbi:hypothetical protein F5Y01DRAFT_322783 [Xylaria sp. FL0043]|nr:hypothetical protein F5Y01DRAFT_322783 [Xylaria sp. FL0043]